VADDALVDETTALARAFADGPRGALRAIKQTLRLEPPNSLEAALTAEASTQRTLGFNRDYREAVIAFAEKRTPHFTREEKS
jgi:2-(1,2-epoxy-1,2-dihydrophenyl)acetyl-CoA isomerase